MIARVGAVTLGLLGAAILETALFPALTLFGYRPHLLVLVVVGLALRDGPLTGARVGAVAGLVSDLLVTQSPVGLSVLVLAAIGYACGVARPYLAPGSVTAPVLVAFAASALATGAYGVLASLLADERNAVVSVVEAALVVGLYSTLLAPLVFWLTDRIAEGFPLRGQVAE